MSKRIVTSAAVPLLLSPIFFVVGVQTLQAASQKTHEGSVTSRLVHAKELLGSHYLESIVQAGELVPDLYPYIQEHTEKSLPEKFKPQAKIIARAILQESEKYGFDPVFVMAVIENESRFSPTALGEFGEIGLMQLKPSTAEWISKRFELPWKGPKTLTNPIANIRLGTAYLSFLRDRFDSHSRLYLAAYNMGVTNVNRALGKQVWPKVYPARVMHLYVRMYAEIARTAHAMPLTQKMDQAPEITFQMPDTAEQ